MTRPSASGTTTAFHDDIRSTLKLADATSVAGPLGRFLIGFGLCFGIGAIAACILTAILDSDSPWIGVKSLFLAYLLIVVPLLIWQERRSRAGYLTEPVRSAEPDPSNPLVTLLSVGPYGLINGMRGLRGQLTLTQEAVLDRATLLVLDLAQVDGGIPVKELLKPPENMHVFGTAVDLLERHDYVGKSTDGRSLWLNSTYRRKLNQRKLNLPEGNSR